MLFCICNGIVHKNDMHRSFPLVKALGVFGDFSTFFFFCVVLESSASMPECSWVTNRFVSVSSVAVVVDLGFLLLDPDSLHVTK